MKNRFLTRSTEIFMTACLILSFSFVSVLAQEPTAGPEKPVKFPPVGELKLKNGLTVAFIQKRNLPIVTVQLLIPKGASFEDKNLAGLAALTAELLTKGTKTRTAQQISEEIELLGGTLNANAGWNGTTLTMAVSSDKLDKAMAIFADVALNPGFADAELELARSQALDGLKYSLTQPGSVASYVASAYGFDEHPVTGTPESLASIKQQDLIGFYNKIFLPESAVLIFSGDIDGNIANKISAQLFRGWKEKVANTKYYGRWGDSDPVKRTPTEKPREILVVDLPNSGQASVNYLSKVDFPKENNAIDISDTLNSLLGGGYSSRLNQEIRIKRGLSYGAGSSFARRMTGLNFSTRTQTKNTSAAEVAELVLAEVNRLETDISEADLKPRKSVLIGDFGSATETTQGLLGEVANQYMFRSPVSELNSYVANINAVTPDQVKAFAKTYLKGGKFIIVGNYAEFKDDLARRFPGVKISVVKIDELDITKPDYKR